MKQKYYQTIALISLTLIPLELIWTRLFSAEFFYTFAFLVLSLAILGLGLGALALRMFDRLCSDNLLGAYLALSGLCALIGPFVVFKLGLDFSLVFADWAMRWRLLLTILILMSSFVFGGMGLALIFKRHHQMIARLYMVDLVAAGLGVVLAIGAMNLVGTPVATVLAALPILVASLLISRSWFRLLPALSIALVFVLRPSAQTMLQVERQEPAPVIYTHWDAMSKIKLYDRGEWGRGINIDNVANTPVYPFDGNWDELNPDSVEWGIDASWLIQQFDSCVFLSLGSGGGSDVLQALVEGAVEVHAVEINDHINYMMTHGDPDGYLPTPPSPPDTATVDSTSSDSAAIADADAVPAPDSVEAADSLPPLDPERIITLDEYSGYLYLDPRVTVVSEDARAYVRRHPAKFDVIYSLSSNTWAALASGAFALAENYLFTTEAFEDYWRSLTDSGFMMMEHQVYMPRIATEVLTALKRVGVERPLDHFAIYDLPQMRRKMVLLSKRPLTDDIRYNAFGELTDEKFEQIHLLYPPAHDSLSDNLINRIITEGWTNVADSAPVNLSPVDDNRPFVAQMGLWRNLTGERLERVSQYAEFYGFPLSGLVMVVILSIVLLVVVPINLLPYLKQGPKLKAAPWLYFFTIGLAFMAVEIVLMQKYALLIGPSLYSVVTILLTLLVASGIGSRFSGRFSDAMAFGFIVAWLLLDAFIFKHFISVAGGFEMPGRIMVTALIIFPLGFFMGMPFPKGTLLVGELIDWGFAVNGAASVLGSVLVLMIAFAWGFAIALTVSALLYLAAFMLIRSRQSWR